MLELDGVVKYYRGLGEEVRAVDGVNLTINPGEMAALLGPSGSGKTTLLLLITGLFRPDAGTITFGNLEVSSLPKPQVSDFLLEEVGVVYQNAHLAARVSALENAASKLIFSGIGLREAQARARPWLERVGLGDRLKRTPEQLSGGECQRVLIARALANEPRLILADEPTGNLDSTRSQEIVALLRSIARERQSCILLVTHDQEVAQAADRRYMMRDGKLTPDTNAGAARTHQQAERVQQQ